MKRYIRTAEAEPEISLSDLFSSISKIKIVEDASDITIDGYDPYEDVYASYSDDELRNLSVYVVQNICRREILAQIQRVAPEKLNSYQKAIVCTLGNQIAQQFTLDDDDLRYLIDKLHKCQVLEKVIVNKKKQEMYPETERFWNEYNLTDAEVLRLIHTLKPSDFDNTTNSVSPANLYNDLYVFYPRWTFTDHQGKEVKDLLIYLKLDYDVVTSDGRIVALMSFHAADENKYKEMIERRKNGVKLQVKKLNRYEDNIK